MGTLARNRLNGFNDLFTVASLKFGDSCISEAVPLLFGNLWQNLY